MDKAGCLLLAAGGSLAGMGWLALSLEAHWQQVVGKGCHLTPARQRQLRAGGYASLLLALAACLLADHPSMAALTWPMLLAAAALSQALLLAWQPHLLRWLLPPAWRGTPHGR